MKAVYQHFTEGFARAAGCGADGCRIGAELKFPLVKLDGTAADLDTVLAFWRYLAEIGWEPIEDRVTGSLAGARKAGPYNDTIASCETGYCKTEFSLAHVGDLFELDEAISRLRGEIGPFAAEHGVRFLGYGIQPVTPPGKDLLFKKERSCFWDKAVPSNEHIPPEEGDDVYLFTVNAGSHVHLSLGPEDCVRAVNVLGGLAGPQIALMAHSPVWKGRVDDRFQCVSEMLWDWWKPAQGRSGVPDEPFSSLDHYVRAVQSLPPIYVKREGGPVILRDYRAFSDYYAAAQPAGETLAGRKVELVPRAEDIGVHNSCYWYTARISRYFTVENRVFDQQPPDELATAAALTLGLASALDEAWDEVSRHPWPVLRELRLAACRAAVNGDADHYDLWDLAGRMLDVARLGLVRRELGEESFIEPLFARLRRRQAPAACAAAAFQERGVRGLIDALTL